MFEAVEDGLCIDPPSAHLTQYLSSCYGTKKGLAVWHSDMHHGDHLPLFTSSNFDPFGATKPCAESGSGSRFALLVSIPCRVYIENLIIITTNKNPCAFSVTKRPLIKPIHEVKSYLAIRRYIVAIYHTSRNVNPQILKQQTRGTLILGYQRPRTEYC